MQITRVDILPDGLLTDARLRATAARCPDCRRGSRRGHSRYTRKLAVRPIGTRRVTTHLAVRRYRCQTFPAGLATPTTVPDDLPPLRVLLVLDNLAGDLSSFVIWLLRTASRSSPSPSADGGGGARPGPGSHAVRLE